MTRTGKGVGPSIRFPIRGVAKLFRELDAFTRQKLEKAFEEAEDMVDFHSRSVPQRQNRRRITGLVEIPSITAESSALGGSVTWERTKDPRIHMYEVEVSDDNVFSNPSTFTVLETFFAVENISTTKYVRVRAIRSNGDTGNWSNTGTLPPTSDAPKVFTASFYQGYWEEDGSERIEPTLSRKHPYGGQREPGFYKLWEHSFTPTRDTGSVQLFGFISNRLKDPRDSNIRPWDRVKWTVQGITRAHNFFCHWTDTFGDEDHPPTNPTTGDPLSFYAHGGYTANFGPWTLPYPPSTYRGQGPLDPRRVFSFYIPGTHAGRGREWDSPKSVRRPSWWDQTPLTNTLIDAPYKMKEASVGIPFKDKTQYLCAHNFGFTLPFYSTVNGIQVDIRRRQFGEQFDEDIHRNWGPLRNSVAAGEPENGGDFDTLHAGIVYGPIVDSEWGGKVVSFGIDPNPVQSSTLSSVSSKVLFASGTTDFTMATWFKAVTVGATNVLFFQHSPGTTMRAILRVLNGNQPGKLHLQAWIYEGVGAQYIQRQWNNVAYKNRMHLISMRYEEQTDAIGGDNQGDITKGLTIELDGQSLGNPNSDYLQPPPVSDFTSRDNSTAYKYWQYSVGSLNLVYAGQTFVWGKALTLEELEAIHSLGPGFDARVNFGSYQSAEALSHYWFKFPQVSYIEDDSVILRDESGDLRSDLDDKAITTEAWPILTNFYADGTAGGIPHDSLEGLGYQSYGGSTDLWGRDKWRPSWINGFYFGVAISAKNVQDGTTAWGFIDHMKITVWYTDPDDPGTIDIGCYAEAVNQFYVKREVFGGVINGIEVGEDA